MSVVRWWMVIVFVVGDGIIRGPAQHNVRAQEGRDIGSIQIIENASAELAAASAAEGEIAVASAPASANANPHLSFCLHRKPRVLCALLQHRRHGYDHVHMRPCVGSVRGPCWQLLMGFSRDALFAELSGTVLMQSTADTIHIILLPAHPRVTIHWLHLLYCQDSAKHRLVKCFA